jgi:hypothetical protein
MSRTEKRTTVEKETIVEVVGDVDCEPVVLIKVAKMAKKGAMHRLEEENPAQEGNSAWTTFRERFRPSKNAQRREPSTFPGAKWGGQAR